MSLFVSEILQRKITLARNARPSRETARSAFNCLNFSLFEVPETEEEIYEGCDIAKYNGVHSLSVYPNHVHAARIALRDSPVIITTVINFPTGQLRTLIGDHADAGTIATDVYQAIKHGARQIEMVLPLDYFKSGTVSEINEIKAMLRACRNACANGETMKVIFETAAFDSSDDLRRACQIAIGQKADCLKTSTDKHPAGGATMEAAAILMDEASKSPYLVGCEVSGGIRTNEDCAKYIALNEGLRGRNSIRPEFFRIGASSLIDDLISALGSKDMKRFAGQSLGY